MPWADVGGLRLYYEQHGSGPRAVFISGTGGDLRQSPERHHDHLTQHLEVLMYDQRGLGRSDKPDVPYTMADYADDCVALMDHVGWPRANVIGISFGGMVAQHVALRHPERVERLVLACTSSGGAGGDSFDLLAVDDLPAAERGAVVLPVMDTRNDLTRHPPTLAPAFDTFIAAMLGAAALNADDPGAARGARLQLEARAGHDVWDQLDRIAAPTLVMGGRFDALAPLANSERLASRIPGATLQVFDGGHIFVLQDPTAWPAVTEFLIADSPS